MNSNNVKMKRALGFWSSYLTVFGCILSGTAMVTLGNVTGYTGSSVWVPALIAIIPMLAVACAYSELVPMLPGGGMVGDYTMPALGRFWAIFATLAGYLILVTADGGTQVIIAGNSIEQLTGIPQLAASIGLFVIAVLIQLFGIGLFGKVEGGVSLIMVLIFLMLGLTGVFGLTDSPVVNEIDFLEPADSWGTTFSQAGAIIWWFIGFEFICPTAEENKCPHKNIPRALILGVLSILILDLIFSYGATRFSDLEALTQSATPHVMVGELLLGKTGFVMMAIITICAAFTSAMVHLVALPRLLYGLACKRCAPKIFMYLHPKFRTPWAGIFVTAFLIACTLIYIQMKGADVDSILGLVNVACTTWMCSYGIAMIDVLVLRKRYPDYPRLFFIKGNPVIMAIGLLGLLYCIWTMQDSWLMAGVSMAIIALYSALWLKKEKLPLFQPEPIEDAAKALMQRSEPYTEWDEAVTAWIKGRA